MSADRIIAVMYVLAGIAYGIAGAAGYVVDQQVMQLLVALALVGGGMGWATAYRQSKDRQRAKDIASH